MGWCEASDRIIFILSCTTNYLHSDVTTYGGPTLYHNTWTCIDTQVSVQQF